MSLLWEEGRCIPGLPWEEEISPLSAAAAVVRSINGTTASLLTGYLERERERERESTSTYVRIRSRKRIEEEDEEKKERKRERNGRQRCKDES